MPDGTTHFWQCPRCGLDNLEDEKACVSCGRKRDGREEMFSKPPTAGPRGKGPVGAPVHTDYGLMKKRREEAEEGEKAFQEIEEKIEEARQSYADLMDEPPVPKDHLSVPNTWFGWAVIVFLIAVMAAAAALGSRN